MMTQAPVESDRPVYLSDSLDLDLVGFVEILEIFAGYLRKGVAGLIEHGDFPAPYGELVGLTVWERNDVESWLTNHPDIVQNLVALAP